MMGFEIGQHPMALQPPPRITRESAWLQHTPMVPVIMALLEPRTFVELGTHNGDSYCAFCEAARQLRTHTQCAAVDTWAGDPHAGQYGPEILAGLRTFHDARYGGFSRLMQMTFDQAAVQFAEGSVDLLHIDGLHTYDAVRHDFETWRPKLSQRGVVLFHDTEARLAGYEVWRFWQDIADTGPSVNVPYGWGLGMLAVGKEVPAGFLEFLGALRTEPHLVTLFGALGQRNELIRDINCAGESLYFCHDLVRQWRQATGLPPGPVVDLQQVVRFPSGAGPVVVKGVLDMANDAVGKARELEALKKSAAK